MTPAPTAPHRKWQGWWRDRHGDWDCGECTAATEREAEADLRYIHHLGQHRRVIVSEAA